MRHINLLLFALFVTLLGISCNENTTTQPKPRGYFKIEFPEKKYDFFQGNSYSFKYPSYTNMDLDKDYNALPEWYNMNFQQFNGKLHISYYPITSKKQFEELTEDARKLVYKHTIKASAIDQKIIQIPAHNVYGFLYNIEGNAASWVQFFLTDSSSNYLRGALYFKEKPQLDSIKPVLEFIKKDIDTLIQTLRWKKQL